MTEDKIEEETYSLIFTSLKHPIRRRILRMLADKPLTYSEILDILNIDSGHLSYHLENLGDLTVHSSNGQYRLSSFGTAAVKLMGGVEEQKTTKHKQTTKPKQILAKIYPIILAFALIGASFHLVTYYTSTETTVMSTADSRYPIYETIPFNLGTNKTFEIAANIQYEQSSEKEMGVEGNFQDWTFTIPQLEKTFTSWDEATIWLETHIERTESSQFSAGVQIIVVSYNRTLEPYNVTFSIGGPDIIQTMTTDFSNFGVEIFAADGTIIHENAIREENVLDISSFPSTPIMQEGKYAFKLSNKNDWEQAVALSLNVQIQHFEKPYFYWGIAGIIIALGYILLAVIMAVKSKKSEQ